MQKIEEHYSLLTIFVQGSIIDERFPDLNQKFILFVCSYIIVNKYRKKYIV